MDGIVFFLVGPAGALGAVSRWWLDGVIKARMPRLPAVGIVVVNIVACFLAGIVVHLLRDSTPGSGLAQCQQIISVGFLGGLSTFSTAVIDVVELLKQRRIIAGMGILLGALVLSAAAFWLGARIAG